MKISKTGAEKRWQYETDKINLTYEKLTKRNTFEKEIFFPEIITVLCPITSF